LSHPSICETTSEPKWIIPFSPMKPLCILSSAHVFRRHRMMHLTHSYLKNLPDGLMINPPGDGNCLPSCLAFFITGSIHLQQGVRETLFDFGNRVIKKQPTFPMSGFEGISI
jgi:hypothetical protein